MKLKGKSVMVAGGAGFIGSHLVDRILKEKPARLDIVDNMFLGKEANIAGAAALSNVFTNFVDAADDRIMPNLMEKAQTDVVFNLAVVPLPTCLEDPAWTFKKNVDITLNLCELQRLGKFKTLVQFSSSEAYGSAIDVPMSEYHPLNPCTPYAASKAAGDHLVLSYVDTFKTDCAIVRPFNNYGPRQNEGSYAGIIPLTIKRILTGKEPVIYGDGKQTRDFIYVTDTADAAVKLYNTQKSRGRIVNIASGKETTVNQVIKTIADCLEYREHIKLEAARIGDVRRHCGDASLAKRLIGFKPTVSFEDGIQRTVHWYYPPINEDDGYTKLIL